MGRTRTPVTQHKIALTPKTKRVLAVAFANQGQEKAAIARQLFCSRSTVYGALQMANLRGHVNSAPKSGRNKKTTPAQDARMVEIAKENRWIAPLVLAALVSEDLGFKISVKTMHRRLHEQGIHRCSE